MNSYSHDPASGRPEKSHQHLPGPDADRRFLRAALILVTTFVVAEVVIAVTARSLALLSDAGHMLADIGAIGGALWAIHLAVRPPAPGPSAGSGPRSSPPRSTASRCWSWRAS